MKAKHILVPIDFSANSINALKWAVEIGKRANAKLHLIHSFEHTATYAQVNYLAFMESIMDSTKKHLMKDLKALEASVEGLNELSTTYHVVFDYAIKGIKEYAIEKKIDLIIMGTRGNNDVTNKLIGSITSSIIENTSIPVLAIPEEIPPRELENVVFADDYKKVASDKALSIINEIAKLYSSSLTILHVTKSSKESDAIDTEEVLNLARAFKEINHTYDFEVNSQADQGIIDFVEKHNSDLLVLMPHKHGFFHTLFNNSVTERIVHNLKVPMLAIQDY